MVDYSNKRSDGIFVRKQSVMYGTYARRMSQEFRDLEEKDREKFYAEIGELFGYRSQSQHR